MRREIRALQRQLGITMVYVTHDQAEAMSMADQVVLLRDGVVEQDAAPEELYSRPASAFAASFIGTPPMNLIPLPALAAAGWSAAQPGEEGMLGVRPEDIRFDDEPGADGIRSEGVRGVDGTVAARIDAVEYLGADALVTCKLPGAEMVVRASGRHRFEPGRAVRLGWSSDAEHRFDPRSGARLPGR
jgi:sn-glycerol 3-phosphate transport system ATP-binding protein